MIKGKNRNSIFTTLISLLLLMSCNSDIVYTDSAAMEKRIWSLMNIPVFHVTIADTINSNNVFFTLRTGSGYPYRNIYLFVTATSPEGKSITDTLQYFLADEQGKWYGRGFGDVKEHNLPYKSNVYFPSKGEYIFKIQHGMRIRELEGVYDIGLRIEKAGK